MLRELESIINADEIANTFALSVVIQGNNDLSRFSGWSRTMTATVLLNISRCPLNAGKYWATPPGVPHRQSAEPGCTRFVQNGPAYDGFSFPQRGRGAAEAPEPVIGAPAGGAPPAGAGRGGRQGGGGRQ